LIETGNISAMLQACLKAEFADVVIGAAHHSKDNVFALPTGPYHGEGKVWVAIPVEIGDGRVLGGEARHVIRPCPAHT